MSAQLRQVAEIQRLHAIRIYTLERKLQTLEERLDQLLSHSYLESLHSTEERPAQGDEELGRLHVGDVKPGKQE